MMKLGIVPSPATEMGTVTVEKSVSGGNVGRLVLGLVPRVRSARRVFVFLDADPIPTVLMRNNAVISNVRTRALPDWRRVALTPFAAQLNIALFACALMGIRVNRARGANRMSVNGIRIVRAINSVGLIVPVGIRVWSLQLVALMRNVALLIEGNSARVLWD